MSAGDGLSRISTRTGSFVPLLSRLHQGELASNRKRQLLNSRSPTDLDLSTCAQTPCLYTTMPILLKGLRSPRASSTSKLFIQPSATTAAHWTSEHARRRCIPPPQCLSTEEALARQKQTVLLTGLFVQRPAKTAAHLTEAAEFDTTTPETTATQHGLQEEQQELGQGREPTIPPSGSDMRRTAICS
jgi:hypothetical protein